MLADEGGGQARTGRLSSNIHYPGEWLSSLITLIIEALPEWRDDLTRPKETGENKLTAQLCAYLNGMVRCRAGWDNLQFKREEPDDANSSRVIDLVAAPSGTIITIEGREYTQYQTLLPIECKRLPVPRSTKRDEREYLYSGLSTTGGVQRFKAGHHGAAHARAAMIAYIQEEDILYWKDQVNSWVNELQATGVYGWTLADQCQLVNHKVSTGAASLNSLHTRLHPLEPIALDHLWIEM